MVRLVFFCCSTDYDDCCCWLFFLFSLFPCFCFRDDRALHDHLGRVAPQHRLAVHGVASPPPGFFGVSFCGVLVLSRRPNGVFGFRCLSAFAFLFFGFFVRLWFRSVCGLAWFVPPPSPPSCCLLCCASCIYLLHLGSNKMAHCHPQWPRPPPVHHLARLS